jgi:ADP-ribosylglycohydrolase
MSITLREKFFGCICGAHIGSAMGAVVEGYPYTYTEEKYGTLDKLMPYEAYDNGWMREPGTTEDGIDRQKLMITAIIEKGDRVNAEDVRKIWCRDIKPGAPGGVCEPFEGELLALAKAKIPARDLGKYCDYSCLVTFARSCHAIGLINAGDIQGAIDDVLEVGQLYHTSNSRALKWACVTAVGIAAATLPGATVDSVLDAIFENLDERAKVEGRDDGWYAEYAGLNIVDELKTALEKTANCKDFREMRAVFDTMYNGGGMPYAMAYANEIVTKGICIFKKADGDLKKAMIYACNMGRDTDCLAAIAAGLTGALSGTSTLPAEWIKQTDYATSVHRFTNNKRTLRENSDGLYNAYKNRLQKMRSFADSMDME